VKAQLLGTGNEATFALVFDQGDEAVEGIATFAREQHLEAGHFTCSPRRRSRCGSDSIRTRG
jgi:predicted DNA-binding protein with PD1-like motif